MANLGQMVAVVHFADKFEKLIAAPEALAIVLLFIVAPDVLKKFLSVKYGANPK